MLIVELVILCILFWGICYLNTGSDDKNIKSYASYPDEVQEMVKKNPALQFKIKTVSPFVSFISNIVVFGTVLFIFGLFVKENGFKANFISLLILGQCLNTFDFLVIDMLWWRNSKRVRFADTKDRKELYSNPKKHFASFLKGIAAFLIIAVIDGAILTLF
jgi:hypothetical protein